MLLGANDRQDIRAGEAAADLRSPGWNAEYGKRAAALGKVVTDRDIPLLWVGQPAYRSRKTSEHMAAFNELYRAAATKVGGEFVDVWDGFVDAEGAFVSRGPDVGGQPAQLRNGDGITMTPAGADKLAFFVEKPLEKLLGSSILGSEVATVRPDSGAAPAPNLANATAVPAMSLAGASIDGGDALLGGVSAGGAGPSETPSPREKLVLFGGGAGSASGRADDFSWNSKSGPVDRAPATASPVVSQGKVELGPLRAGAKPPEPPKPMPSLQDAIIEDWEAQNKVVTAPQPAKPSDR